MDPIITAGLFLLLTIRGIQYLRIYRESYLIHEERIRRIEQALEDGETIVYVPAFPYPDNVHASEPSKMGYVYFNKEKLDVFIRLED